MPSTAEFEQEKLALSRLLASGVFNRAPNLALLLNYVCSKYFEGVADQIKEYNIAVEALGRPVEFDQRADSIVRVELHRLRKRLKEYYEHEGAGQPVQIDIPPGQYAPRFITVAPPDTPAAVEAPPPQPAATNGAAHAATPPPEISAGDAAIAPAASVVRAPSKRRRLFWVGVAAALLIGALGPIGLRNRNRNLEAQGADLMLPPAGDTIRILCGLDRGTYIDRFGYTWRSDEFFTGGSAVDSVNHPIWGTRDPRLYNYRREGQFRYDIPLNPGVYELRLHFAETVYGENNTAG